MGLYCIGIYLSFRYYYRGWGYLVYYRVYRVLDLYLDSYIEDLFFIGGGAVPADRSLRLEVESRHVLLRG